MNILNKQELLSIKGGELKLTAALFSSIVRGVNSLFDIGKALGSSIRRWSSGNICPF